MVIMSIDLCCTLFLAIVLGTDLYDRSAYFILLYAQVIIQCIIIMVVYAIYNYCVTMCCLTCFQYLSLSLSLQSITLPLQGFLNAIVYGWTRDDFISVMSIPMSHDTDKDIPATDPEGIERSFTETMDSQGSLQDSGVNVQ